MTKTKCNVLIIGSGPAGYSAAIYAVRAGLKTCIVTGNQPGGQLTITTDVENYPGFAEAIQGPWLMEQMQQQAANLGVNIVHEHIKEVNLKKNPNFSATDTSGNEYSADSVIISTGAQASWLGLESEEKFKGFGVSGCATCDAFFFKNQKVMVVGGGNTAVEEALYLTNHASEVILIHRRDSLRAEKIMQERLFNNKKITVIWDSVLKEVTGEEQPKKVTGAIIENVKTNETSKIDLDGIFIAIGHKPNTALFQGQVEMDEQGYIITKPGTTTTNVAGVFAAGDVQDKTYRQAVTAAGTGCMAALDANKFLTEEGIV